ncbi:MAG: hypothetical protein K6U74_19625, partial [Firmicutes bacterium]|nr:hypothetical protein [Bacillota bacterium]
PDGLAHFECFSYVVIKCGFVKAAVYTKKSPGQAKEKKVPLFSFQMLDYRWSPLPGTPSS